MQEIYLRHYWGVFSDFINAFQELTYKDIPLPLLANFYQYIDYKLKAEMMKPGFKEYLSNKQLTKDRIQPYFEQFLNNIKNPIKRKSISGKVLLNFDYLRFSSNNYSDYFNPEQTVIFARWKKNEYFGIPVHNIKDYKIDVTEITKKFIEKANAIFLAYNDHPVLNNHYLRNKFIDEIPVIVEYIAAIYRYLEEVPISCIIVGTTEEIISRILTIVASVKGIPSICMQHGLLGAEEAYLPVFSTKMAVYGEYEKDWYQSKGVSKDRIAIIGHPRFDDIFTQKPMSKIAFQEKYGLNPKKKWILIASQPHNVLLWSQLIELLAQEPFEILIKPHPWELSREIKNLNFLKNNRKLMENYEYFSNKYQSIKLISEKGVKLYDILANVDAVVLNLSTVGLEAMLFEKMVFILSKTHYEYYDRIADFVQSDPARLVKLIKNSFQDEELQKKAERRRKEFLSYAYPERLAGKRLLELIYELTEKGS